MAIAAPIFYGTVTAYLYYAVNIATLLICIVAFVHCVIQRVDAFQAIGTFSKGIWLALLGASLMINLFGLAGLFGPLAGMVIMITVIIALVYLLDVRPALRDAVDGQGPY